MLGRFVDVCNAIAYAHSRGIIHRDLKPGNIMLGKYGETLVVDWGLAKPMESREPACAGERRYGPSSVGMDTTETLMGSAIGTPAFMSPEQAAGKIDQLGPASDVYSLGATLYCLLTGKCHRCLDCDRKASGTWPRSCKKCSAANFRARRQLKTDVDPALEAICLRAMSLKSADRYRSPAGLGQ